jgi:hypothetical protein
MAPEPRYAGPMLPLTVQQRTRRCRCERYLAWPLLAAGAVIAGCFTLDLVRVREPEGDDPDCE